MATLSGVLARAEGLAEHLHVITTQVNAKALDPIRVALAKAQAEIVSDWVRTFGSIDAKPETLADVNTFIARTRGRLDQVFTNVGPAAEKALATAWPEAYQLGVQQGLASPAVPEDTNTDWRVIVPTLELAATIAAARLLVTSRLNPMQALLTGFPAIARSLKAADSVVPRMEARNASEITRAASDGTSDVANATGTTRVWVAERDACVNCTAYAGVTSGGDVFPVGLTYGTKAVTPPGPLTGPPLHPHCRCSIELIDATNTAIPDALKREAKRSILRGFSLPSESEPARLRAADRLLSQMPGMPKTVEQYAERAVRRGRFPSRDVPTGA